MKTNTAPGYLDQTRKTPESLEHAKNDSASHDKLWAGMMTANVFGGKLFS